MNREQPMTDLAERAAAAIEIAWVERVKEDRPDTLSDRAARAALAVFEEAHTVTGAHSSSVSVSDGSDDEREALARIAGHAWSDSRQVTGIRVWDLVAGAILAAGFRRTVQGEPPCQYCGRPISEHPGGVYCPAGPVQGEATDAQVVNRGTFGHVWPCPLFYVGNWKHGDEAYEPVRECTSPAVCAASTVKEGENR